MKIVNVARKRLTGVINSSISLVRNNDMSSVPKIYFCHVPKCGGTSLVSAIWEQIYSGWSVERFEIEREPSLRAAKVLGTSMMNSRESILAYNLSIQRNYFGRGHCYCRPNLVREFSGEWSFVTILRHPIERWISEYVYNTYKESRWLRNELSLNEYLASKKGASTGRCLVRYFSSESSNRGAHSSDNIEEALGNLSQFSVAGTLDDLDCWVGRMNQRFGVSLKIPRVNASPRSQVVEEIKSDAKTMKKIEELCRYDLELYNRYLDEIDTDGRSSGAPAQT